MGTSAGFARPCRRLVVLMVVNTKIRCGDLTATRDLQSEGDRLPIAAAAPRSMKTHSSPAEDDVAASRRNLNRVCPVGSVTEEYVRRALTGGALTNDGWCTSIRRAHGGLARNVHRIRNPHGSGLFVRQPNFYAESSQDPPAN